MDKSKKQGQRLFAKVLLFCKKNVLFIIFLIFILCGGYQCPFKMLTKIDCPGCGLTRAVKSMFKLDFYSALRYHPLVFLVVADIFYFSTKKYIPLLKRINKKTDGFILLVTLMLLLIVWFYRQFIK